jgi:hypothetical protein
MANAVDFPNRARPTAHLQIDIRTLEAGWLQGIGPSFHRVSARSVKYRRADLDWTCNSPVSRLPATASGGSETCPERLAGPGVVRKPWCHRCRIGSFRSGQAVSDGVPRDRGYRSPAEKTELELLGFPRTQQLIRSPNIPIRCSASRDRIVPVHG